MGFFFKNNRSTDSSPESFRARVITFLNQKGGVGKTTMAFNTAHALAAEGKKVLVIDMDPQANISLLCGYDISETDDYHIYHLLINSVRELKALHTPTLWTDVVKNAGKLDLIPSGQELSGFELSVAGINSPRQLVLKRFLERSDIMNQYDYIVIDSPPTLGLLVVNILCAAQGLLVPFKADDFSRKGLGHLNEVLEDIEDMGVTQIPEILAHIPNLVDARRKQEGDDLSRITDSLSHLNSTNVVEPFYNRAQLVKSQAQRKSVFDYSSKEYEQLQGQFQNLVTIIEEWGSGNVQ
ncbi:MAG: ParA family protein [Deltaproteobacteria bacterium]|nr:MAG: ParA family protein [Deltaproteobacteria bacterium]